MSAVEVFDGYKYYGRAKNPKIILNHLDMKVESGTM